MKAIAIILGVVLVIVAVRGTEVDSVSGSGDGQGLFPLLAADLESQQLKAWVAAIVIIGVLGYIPTIQPIADGLIALLLGVLLLSKGQFFDQLSKAILQGKAA
jgi:hypothetical protein